MIIIDRVQMNLKTMLVLTGIAVAVFVVAATIAIPIQTASAQSTNTISAANKAILLLQKPRKPTKSTRR
jgi:hypothetical protein